MVLAGCLPSIIEVEEELEVAAGAVSGVDGAEAVAAGLRTLI